jgi:hypothetical protein
MSKNKKMGQVIKTVTVKWKVKHDYMKQDDGISTTKKKQNFLFLCFANIFLSFSISRMGTQESFIENL